MVCRNGKTRLPIDLPGEWYHSLSGDLLSVTGNVLWSR